MTQQYQFTLEGMGMNPHYESRDFYFLNYLFESVAKILLPYKLTAYHLQQENKSWVISDILVELYTKPLKWMDKMEVYVGFRNTKGLRIAIDFEAFHNKEKIAQATMQWTVIDEIKRRPMAHPLVEKKLPLWETAPYKGFKFPKIDAINEVISVEKEVSYSDIDFNHHLNAYQYFRFIYDSLPTSFIDQHYPVKYQAKFEREIMLGQMAKMSTTFDKMQSKHKITRSQEGQECCSFKLKVDWAER